MRNSISIQSFPFYYNALGDSTLVLSTARIFNLQEIHQVGNWIRNAEINGVTDVVTAYQSITIYFTPLEKSAKKIIKELENLNVEQPAVSDKNGAIITHKIPVNFEKGLDWNEVEQITQLSKSEIVQIFINTTYTVAMLGFIPGFVYLEGLDSRLECTRKSIPRTKIPKGGVGIGGKQAGIYALESPGGWQIIGQTDLNLFDINRTEPMMLKPLDKVNFIKE